MNRKEFLKLPFADYNEEIPLLDTIVFIPTRRKHDSGYNVIEIAGFAKDYAKRIDIGCDVMELPKARIDMTNGCFRVFSDCKFKVIWNLSDFKIELVEKEGK